MLLIEILIENNQILTQGIATRRASVIRKAMICSACLYLTLSLKGTRLNILEPLTKLFRKISSKMPYSSPKLKIPPKDGRTGIKRTTEMRS